jgi:uncharacterized membrane protein YoaK (UPF0700 family)
MAGPVPPRLDTGTVPEPAAVKEPWLFAGLFLLTVVTGVIDATSFLGLGEVFTANMTGNVLLLGFAATQSRAASLDHLSFLGTLLALLGFVAGALLGARVAGRRGRRPRLGAGLVAEWLVLAGAVAAVELTHPAGRVRYLAVMLLGLAMGVQIAVVRRMGVADVNTTVLTTVLGGLAADVVEIGGRPANAGRRVATVVCIFVGAILGALLVRHGAVWGVVGGLAVMSVATVAMAQSGILQSAE